MACKFLQMPLLSLPIMAQYERNFLMEARTMEFETIREGNKLTYKIKGRLDTATSPELQEALDLGGVKELVFDLKETDYVFSAGLRIFLQAQKIMNANDGTMRLINVQDSVKEIFNIVGFTGIMDIE